MKLDKVSEKNEPCDVIKGREEGSIGKEKPFRRFGRIDATRLIISDTLTSFIKN